MYPKMKRNKRIILMKTVLQEKWSKRRKRIGIILRIQLILIQEN